MHKAGKLVNNDIEWLAYRKNLILDIARPHIFKIEVNAYANLLTDYEMVLSDQELTKVKRFVHIQDGHRYAVGKHVLRNILSKFTGVSPAKLRFETRENKKPVVDGIEFNVSHSHNIIIVAVNASKIGIDIELINTDFDYELLLPGCFSKNEQSYIQNGGESRIVNFYTLWTRKEAILKASGEGLSDQLDQIDSLADFSLREGLNYRINSSLVDKHYIMSLALEHTAVIPSYWHYSD
uniref:4'-phosphopantetheinyl transferase family protein n=1 Tax=Pedobacter schmidteae TaxID=2201271 RepID=UPI000EB4E69A|nr:4'-phosphopantetheinyl transferase superfamily protein [Pedobacter schmidteae]